MGSLRFELRSIAPKANTNNFFSPVDCNILDEFISFRKIEGLNDKWIYHIRQFVTDYLDHVNWSIDKKKSLEYLNKIKDRCSSTTYRKKVYQIRKFLTFLHLDWAKDINPPPELYYIAKRMTVNIIKDTLSYFSEHKFYKQIKAIILLGSLSG